MKIAFVNQPIDTILPPYQTSIGACSYGAAQALAKSCEVTVYGLKDRHPTAESDHLENGVHFRFLPSTFADRVLWNARSQYSRFVQTASPASTSERVFPGFGRNVALDLRDAGCDVIHIQHFSPFVPVIRATNPHAKLVLHLHAEWFSQNRPETLERLLDHVDLLTTVSDHITTKVRREFPSIADRCATTYNGIDEKEFSRPKDYNGAGKRGEKRILYAGALSPHKGVHVLIEAFNIVAKEYPHVHLDIVGIQGTYPIEETFDLADHDLIKTVAPFYTKHPVSRLKAKMKLAQRSAGTYLAYLQDRMAPEAVNKVSFGGLIPRPDLLDRYFDADVFAFPPIWDEGFGIPPVEAMAAGVPVVASRSGAVVETVRDGETGFLVPKNDPRALAEGILKLLKDDSLADQMGRNGRTRALKHFTWNRVAGKMFDCYNSLCSGIGSSSLPSSV